MVQVNLHNKATTAIKNNDNYFNSLRTKSEDDEKNVSQMQTNKIERGKRKKLLSIRINFSYVSEIAWLFFSSYFCFIAHQLSL